MQQLPTAAQHTVVKSPRLIVLVAIYRSKRMRGWHQIALARIIVTQRCGALIAVSCSANGQLRAIDKLQKCR